jgi:hypothetical protein
MNTNEMFNLWNGQMALFVKPETEFKRQFLMVPGKGFHYYIP